jgi:DNA-binding GntR family transcriptional regulator
VTSRRRPPGSLAERAYHAVRETILRGQLPPGTPLSRRRLARDLRMSVIPVTEALRRLENDGLVETRARAGTRVRVPTDQDVRELYEVREALEAQSARLFAERATAAQCAEVRKMAAEVDVLFGRLFANPDDVAFRSAVHGTHVQFHMRVAQYAGCAALTELIERNHILILNWLFDVAGRRSPLPEHFHFDLGEALTSGDPERASAAMRAHVRYGLREVSGRLHTLAAGEWRERRRPRPRKPS